MTARCLPALFALVAAVGCAPADADLRVLEGHLEALEERVEFPRVSVGERALAHARFHNRGGASVQLRARVEPAYSAVVVLRPVVNVAPAGTVSVELAFLPVDAHPLEATLLVEHDGAAPTLLRVALGGTVRPPPDCDDHNPCTLDTQEPLAPGGCNHAPVESACDDGDACTTQDRCVAGTCQGGGPLDCDDGVACTADTCDPAAGCRSLPVNARCADQDPCTADECAPAAGGCRNEVAPTGTPCGPPSCVVMNLCVSGECRVFPTPDGFPCDDGDPCSDGDTCVAGQCAGGTGGVGLGDAVAVVDATTAPDPTARADPYWDPGVLFGYSPVDVVGAAASGGMPWLFNGECESSLCGTPADNTTTLVAWRGSEGWANGCATWPSQCASPADPCAPAAVMPASMQLKLLTVNAQGLAWPLPDFPLADVYARVRQGPGSFVPPASAAAAKSIEFEGRLYGAALINFGDGCAACSETQPVPSECIPHGTALVTFAADHSGFSVGDVSWLGPRLDGQPAPPLLQDSRGLPALDVSVRDDMLAVAMAVVNPDVCLDCDECGCFASVDFRVNIYRLPGVYSSSLAPAWVAQRQIAGPQAWPAPVDGVVDFQVILVQPEAPVVAWRQPAGGATPASACMLAPGAPTQWVVVAGGAAPSWATSDGATPVNGVRLLTTSRGVERVRWQSTGTLVDGVCRMHDEVTLHGSEGAFPLWSVDPEQTTDALAVLGAAVLQDRAVMVGVTLGGQVTLSSLPPAGGPATGPSVHRAGFPPQAGQALSARHAPVVASGAAGRPGTVVTMGEAGIWRDSLPTPILAVLPLACGAGP
ncbi:MAG: hypothetical protein HY904_03340 [Deltaproteobacteria bacterium]|nr:hypothetical protein [Deltaproteobacteria bacterium]